MFTRIVMMMIVLSAIMTLASAGHPQPEAVMNMDPDSSQGILAGIPVTLSAGGSHDVFDVEYKIVWTINGFVASRESTFVTVFHEGDYEVILSVETGPDGSYGNDQVSRKFHIYKNPAPDIEGLIKYYDPFNDRDTKSNKELSVPQFGSVLIEVWNNMDAKKDDETSYSASVSQAGLEIADSEEDGDKTYFFLFASETGTYNVLVTATDEAGQESSANFVVKVQAPKDLKIDMTPDEVSEGDDIEFQLRHPCLDGVCDYTTSIKDVDRGGLQSIEGEEFTISFDEGPYEVICQVTYNGIVIATQTSEFLVGDIVDDPPTIIITVTQGFIDKPIEIILEAHDDGHEVKVIEAKIYGNYDDETRHISKQIVGDSGTITFTARQTGTYHVIAKACDKKECSEKTLYFDVLPSDSDDEEEEDIPEEEEEEDGDEVTVPNCELCHSPGTSGPECLKPRQSEKIANFEKISKKYLAINLILISLALIMGDLVNLALHKATKEDIAKECKLIVIAAIVIGCLSLIITFLILLVVG